MDTRPARFGKSDGDGLPARLRGSFTAFEFVHLFANELAGLGAGLFSSPGIFPGASEYGGFRHDKLLSEKSSGQLPGCGPQRLDLGYCLTEMLFFTSRTP